VVVGIQTLQLHDRYLYLPGIAIAIGAAVLIRRAPLLRSHLPAQFALVLLLLAFAVPVSCKETSYWSNDVKVFSHSVDVAPTAVLNLETLYDAYVQIGDDAHAEQVLRKTVAEFPGRSREWTRLAMLCVKQDKLDEADACAHRAIALGPAGKTLPYAFSVLSEVAVKRGDLSQAELWGRRAVIADWLRSSAHRDLAMVLAKEGRTAEALNEIHMTQRLEAAAAREMRQ
jgi:Flp pilus assembly protein TadD